MPSQIALKFSLQTMPCKAQAVKFNATETLAIVMWLGKQSHTSLRIPLPCVGEASPGERGFLAFLSWEIFLIQFLYIRLECRTCCGGC